MQSVKITGTKKTSFHFTMIELFFVTGLIALLSTMILQAVSHARARALAARCRSNLRQIGIAQLAYQSNNRDDVLPDIDPVFGSWINFIKITMDYSGQIFKCPASDVHFPPLKPYNADQGCPYSELDIQATYTMNNITTARDQRYGTWQLRGWQNGINIARVHAPESTILITEIPDTFVHLAGEWHKTNAASGSYRQGGTVIHGGIRNMGHPDGWSFEENGKWDGTQAEWMLSDTDHGSPINNTKFSQKRQVGNHHHGGFNVLMGGGNVAHLHGSEPESWIAYEK